MSATSFHWVLISTTFASDADAMDAALELATAGAERGELGIAALVLDSSGRCVAARHDEVRSASMPTAHAAVLALQDASRDSGSWRLVEGTLVVTREPCAMCAGAALSARVRRVLFAVADDRVGCLGSRYNLGADPRLNHEFEIVSGTGAERARMVYERSL